MLILPLHRRPTWDNFPLATVVLILINCFVFAFLQSGDERAYQRAFDYYEHSDLGQAEFPAYQSWLREHDKSEDKATLFAASPTDSRIVMIESDESFLDALHADSVIVPTDTLYSRWHDQREEFERLRDSAFTPRHVIRFSHVEPGRMLTAMFMHGGMEHLIGNMIFLALLGMLVEGALGSGWFLALYLLGGFGSALSTLAWHAGDHGTALGASGAIAALMGAYCVIWGTRKVRVFYWFFIIFDYVSVPALVLLPFWFGWQVLNMWINRDAHIGFDAHAGGILFGAAIAWILRRQGKLRDAYIEADTRADERAGHAAALDEAMRHLGRLDIPKAREILERIDASEPGQLPVLIGLYRCARYRKTPAELDAAVTRVLACKPTSNDDAREIKTIYEDYVKACAGAPRLPPDVLLRLVPMWLRLNDEPGVEALLKTIADRSPTFAGLPAAWFALAMRAPEQSPQRRARLEYVARQHAQSDFGSKARFLLTQA